MITRFFLHLGGAALLLLGTAASVAPQSAGRAVAAVLLQLDRAGTLEAVGAPSPAVLPTELERAEIRAAAAESKRDQSLAALEREVIAWRARRQ